MIRKESLDQLKTYLKVLGHLGFFDVPTSENSLTGIGLGLSLGKSSFNDSSKSRFFFVSI